MPVFGRRRAKFFCQNWFANISVNNDLPAGKHTRFWDTDGNRKWAIFTLNLPSHNHIYIAKSLFSIRDEKYKNLGDDTVLAREMLSSGCPPRLKNARA